MSENKNDLDQFKWDYTKEIRKHIRIGSLILAQPFLNDDVFKRTVCLICAHSRAEGSFGFLLNKITEFRIGDFIEELEDLDLPVYFGGPVANDSLYFVHDNSMQLKNAQKISEGVYWGGGFEEMKEALIANKSNAQNIKFILGYSGWDPGQLRKEIIEDSWIVTEGKAEYVYSEKQDLWKEILEGMGDVYDHMAQLPERPEFN